MTYGPNKPSQAEGEADLFEEASHRGRAAERQRRSRARTDAEEDLHTIERPSQAEGERWEDNE
jgi:hypothetical protein